MVLDRVFRDLEFVRDLFVAIASDEQDEHFALARRQVRSIRLSGQNHLTGWRKIASAFVDYSNRPDQFRTQHILREVRRSASLQHPSDIFVARVCAQRDEPSAGEIASNCRYDL